MVAGIAAFAAWERRRLVRIRKQEDIIERLISLRPNVTWGDDGVIGVTFPLTSASRPSDQEMALLGELSYLEWLSVQTGE
jgi:hypothetical protein